MRSTASVRPVSLAPFNAKPFYSANITILYILAPRSAPLCGSNQSHDQPSYPQTRLPTSPPRDAHKHRQFYGRVNSAGTLLHVSYRMPTFMATALPSSFTLTLSFMLRNFGLLACFWVHSLSPVLLTRNGHHVFSVLSAQILKKAIGTQANSQFVHNDRCSTSPYNN